MGSDISTTNFSKSHGTLSHEKVHDALEVVIRKLGKEGFYFIHKGKEGPKTGKDSNNMWLWIKKSSKSKIKPTVIRIENFIRGTQSRSISPKKGQTLILATVARVPNIDQFQRIAGSSRVEFKGFFDRGYMVNEDFYYVNHPMHKCKKRRHVSTP